MRSLLNPNLTGLGYSTANMAALTARMGANVALVRNSPDLVTILKGQGVETIYRSAAVDGTLRTGTDVIKWVNGLIDAAPNADWYEVANEIGLGPAQDAYMLTCAEVAETRGKKIAAYGLQAAQSDAAWQASLPTMQKLAARGHAIDVHYYQSKNADQIKAAQGMLKWLDQIIGVKFIGEWAYIHDLRNAYIGYRADFAPHGTLDNWLDGAVVPFAHRGLALFIYCADQWPIGAAGKATGFGFEDEPEIQAACATLNARYSTVAGSAFVRGVVHPKAGYANVRAAPATSYNALRQLHEGDAIRYSPAIQRGGVYTVTPTITSNRWLQLDSGWLAYDVVGITTT